MKSKVTVIAMLFSLAILGQLSSAQLLNEEFDYTAGDSLNGIHNWIVQPTASYVNTIKVVSPGLTYTGYPSKIGNAAFVDTTGQDIFRNFPKVTSGSVYAAMLVNFSKATTTGEYFLHLNDSGTFGFLGRVFAKLSGNDVVFGLLKGSTGTNVYTTTTYALNTTHLLILKYTFNSGSTTDDSVYLYLNPAITGTEPAPALRFGSTNTDFVKLDQINLRQGGATNAPKVTVDGIRVDTTWLGVLGIPTASGKIYSIGTGNVPGETEHYATLKAAMDSIKAHINEVTEDRYYYITSDLTEPSNVSIAGNTGGKTITFKPYLGVTPTITFTQTTDNVGLSGGFVIGVKDLVTTSSTNYGVTLNDSTQNIVIDGSNTAGGKTRDLTIKTAAGVHANTNPIRIFGNTNNITIKNTIVSTGQSVTYAILTTVRNSTTAGYIGNYVPDNITIDNCDVTNTLSGSGQAIAISNSGTPTAFPTGVVFSNNKVTARTRGIFLNYSGNTAIYGNDISVTQTSTGNLSEGIYALTIGSNSNVTNIYNNKIQVLSTANTTAGTYGILGIYVGSQGTYNVYNNTVTGFVFPNLAQGIFAGIYVSTATVNGVTANVYHNSVFMANGSNTAGATPPIQTAFYLNLSGASGTKVANVKNNIFVNLESDYTTYAMYVPSTNLGTFNSNYNSVHTSGGSAMVGKYGATDCATLANWVTASTQDSNSVSGDPGFISDADLHIKETLYPVSKVSNAGTPIAEVTTDIDGNARSATTPDIGADEYTANPLVPSAGFLVTPKNYNFGNVWKDSTKTDSVTVTNTGNALALTIDSVTSSNPLFTVTPTSGTIDTNKTKMFVIKFSPTAKGAQSGNIVFYHNAGVKKDTLFVSGTGIIKEAIFKSTPVSLSFQGVLAGSSKKDSIVVENTGTDSLHITGVVSTDADFTVTPTSAHMAAAQTMKFYITFAPTTSTAKAASIVFTSNVAAGKDTVRVYGSVAKLVTITEARKDANNDLIPDYSLTKDTLVIYGVVTSPNFQLSGTSYYIQDAGAGINVFSFNPAGTTFDRGDSIMVIGTIAQFRGLTEIMPLTVGSAHLTAVKKGAAIPAAKRLTSKEFVLNAEKYEGQLVEVDSLIKSHGTWPATGVNSSVYVTNVAKTDTIQLFIDADTQLDGRTEPKYPINVVGLVVQYSSGSTVVNNGYELVPRDSADIKEITIVGVSDPLAGIPDHFELYNNFPNPFNPSTTIRFGLPEASSVSLKIYDAIGREVASLVNENLAAGFHNIQWNARTMASGVYYYRITANATGGTRQSFTNVKKLLLVK